MPNSLYTDAELLEKVEVEPGLWVPRVFALNWRDVHQPKSSFIEVKATLSKRPRFGQSGFGVFPLLPVDFPYPLDSSGNPLVPLAQINCKELPLLRDFPNTGYLQFYISGTGDLYGLNLDDRLSQADSRVLYFEDSEVVRRQTDFAFLNFTMEDYRLPLYDRYGLNFEPKDEFPGGVDIHYEAFKDKYLLPIADRYPEIKEDLLFEIAYCLENTGHKIGGFAHFTQSDPRGYSDYTERLKEFILLLQIGGDEKIMWGDGGVGNFFIHPDDLRKRDFSRVMYNWDCG
jgi:uncharacterized protein YwqG